MTMESKQKARRAGLIGACLGHSFSPQIHALLGDYEYKLYELEEAALGDFLKARAFDALNVTIPHKKAVIPYLDELSPRAARIGAVNTVLTRPDGTLYGDNTDYEGLDYMIAARGVSLAGKKVLILGSGGASLTVQAVVADRGGLGVVISRKGEDNYENLDRHADARIIINATPVGMFPKNGEAPLSLAPFPHLEAVFDLIYNPLRTKLLQEAEARGIVAENGLSMLVAQAHRATELFWGKALPKGLISDIKARLTAMQENIVLIGMPGCGKSTLGRLLADALGKKFLDTDEELERQAGKSIPDIFKTDGEAAFRRLETETLARLTKETGAVIATGGGVVTRPENEVLLRQNGRVIFLDTPPAGLSVAGRPLSQTRTPEALYRERLPLYRKMADITVPITRDVQSNLARIKEKLL